MWVGGNTRHCGETAQYRFVDGYGADDNDHAQHFHASGASDTAAAAARDDDLVGVRRIATNFSLVWEVAPPDDDPCTAPSAVVLYRRYHGGLSLPSALSRRKRAYAPCLKKITPCFLTGWAGMRSRRAWGCHTTSPHIHSLDSPRVFARRREAGGHLAPAARCTVVPPGSS